MPLPYHPGTARPHRTNRLAEQPSGFTLVEIMVAVVVMTFVVAGLHNLMRGLLGHGAKNVSQNLHLQMEARRALLNLYREIQEGIEVLKPDPGVTLPYLVLRDNVNNIHFIYLKKDKAATEKEKRQMFRLYSVLYDIATDRASTPRELLNNVESLNFTAHGYTDVVITSTLREGNATFAFVNQIGLKNSLAEEGL